MTDIPCGFRSPGAIACIVPNHRASAWEYLNAGASSVVGRVREWTRASAGAVGCSKRRLWTKAHATRGGIIVRTLTEEKPTVCAIQAHAAAAAAAAGRGASLAVDIAFTVAQSDDDDSNCKQTEKTRVFVHGWVVEK